MFCYQCEQTAKGQGCDKMGVCGKTPEVAALQDLLVHSLKELSVYAVEAEKQGVLGDEVGPFTVAALFSTLTNVTFDPEGIVELIKKSVGTTEALKAKVTVEGASVMTLAGDLAGLVKQGEEVGIKQDPETDPDKLSIKQIIIYGLKGVAAYADHAHILGQESDSVYSFMHEALAATLNTNLSVDELLGLALKTGEANLTAMEILDGANTSAYGTPVPTNVPRGTIKGKAILVSGHDLKDLDMLLQQTEGKGINIYTHGEMLPTHAYPELKKYAHLYGNYGTAWQNQKKEFAAFPGAILMTTNCIQKPAESYSDNIFTTGLVGMPGLIHIADKNFAPVIEKALELPGFTEDTENGSSMVGFGKDAVLGVADKVIEGVKAKAIRHFFLVAGCDGAKPGRNYYTEIVEKIPQDCVILTLACGKYRFNDKDLGDIGGIPRLLDVGQCNDAYSAIKIAAALAEAFECGLNDLPLSMILSWYEQKAVAILLTLLFLGIKDIRLGPSLPAFITPNVLGVLVDKFDIKPIATPDEDLKTILG